MADGEPRGFDFSKEQVAEHYSAVSYVALGERLVLEAEINDLVSDKESYIKLAVSSNKEDGDKAAGMRDDLKFKKLDLWRATNVRNFLEGEKCAPGSEFLAYAWLQEENKRLEDSMYWERRRGNNNDLEIKALDAKRVPFSSCIVDMERRFPAGIPTFKATEAFLKALPDLVQGSVNVAHGAINKVFGNK